MGDVECKWTYNGDIGAWQKLGYPPYPINRNVRSVDGAVLVMNAIAGYLNLPDQNLPRRSRKGVVATVALIVITLVSGSLWLTQDMRESQRIGAERNAQNLAIGLERDIERVISSYSLSLQGAVRAMALPGFDAMAPETKHAVLFDGVAVNAPNGMAVVDAQGVPVFSSDNRQYGTTNYADRDWFKALRDKTDGGLYVSPPVVGKMSKVRNIALGRRIGDQRGGFAGAAVIGVPVDFFQRLFSDVKLDGDSVVTLLTTTGQIVARTPYSASDFGRDVSSSQLFNLIIKAKNGTYESVSVIDNVRRLYSYRQVGSLPFILVVGLSERSIYATWNRTMWLMAAMSLVLLALGLGLCAILWRESGRRRLAEDRARSASAVLRKADRLLRIVVETGSSLVYAKDPDGRMLMANGPFMKHLGRRWIEIEGKTVLDFLDKAQAEAIVSSDRQVVQSGQAFMVEEQIGKTGPDAPLWLTTKTPMREPDGTIAGLVCLSIDITERKKAEDKLRLMVNELNHRVKNTIATVQAISIQTLRGTDVAVRAALDGRLIALAAAHDVLTSQNWDNAPLAEIVANALRPFGSQDTRRFLIAGPPIAVRPSAALALSLATHELSTNALKYGALSVAHGHVAITWEIIDGSVLRFNWSEHGGPHVNIPDRRGFGTKLVERVVAQDLGGTSRVFFDDPGGVRCRIEAPLSMVVAVAIPLPVVGLTSGL
jgi:PAS domain S-box-containing protein